VCLVDIPDKLVCMYRTTQCVIQQRLWVARVIMLKNMIHDTSQTTTNNNVSLFLASLGTI
jgi:hypothetical protein